MLKSNIDDVIGDLHAYRLVIRGQCNYTQEELAKMGKDIAEIFYDIAPYDGEKDAKFFVSKSISPTNLFQTSNSKATHLIGKGNSITFIEFGTGKRANPEYFVNKKKKESLKNSNYDYATSHGFKMGSYGKGNGSQYGWNFEAHGRHIELGAGGQRLDIKGRSEPLYWTEGNPAGKFMYRASRDMRLDASRIAEKCFKEYKEKYW